MKLKGVRVELVDCGSGELEGKKIRDIFMKPLSSESVGVGCRQWLDENRKEFGLFYFGLCNPFIPVCTHSADNH